MSDEDLAVLRLITGIHESCPLGEVWISAAFAEDDRHRWILLGALMALHFRNTLRADDAI